jgi:PAS domain S-box-containing protein
LVAFQTKRIQAQIYQKNIHCRRIKKVALTEKDAKLFMLAVEMSQDGIIIGDATTGKIGYVNEAIMRMLGHSDRDLMIGKNVLEFVADFDKERALFCSIESVKSGKGWMGQFAALRINGEHLPIELTATPIKDENGTSIAFIDIVRDISDRVQSEKKLEEARRKLELANEKLLVVGGIVRHDIGNKMSGLNASAYLARKRGSLEQLLEATATAYSQINRILDFSRDYEQLGKEQLDYVNVGNVFDEAVGLFMDFKLKAINQCASLTVLSDSLLKETFCNLLDNTLKYGKTTTQVKLSFIKQDKGLRLLYEDDGVGVPAQMKPKLFTKGYGQGTGLGLYLIKKTLEVYGWQITENGTEGKGARFEITIPKDNYKIKN